MNRAAAEVSSTFTALHVCDPNLPQHQRVYHEAGLAVSAAFRAALEQRASEERAKADMRKQQALQRPQPQQRHRYSLAEYGLAQSDLDTAFAVYNAFVREIKK